MMKFARRLGLALATALSVSACAQEQPTNAAAGPPRLFESPMSTIEGILNASAKRICAEHFITGLDVDDVKAAIAAENLGGGLPPNTSERVPVTQDVIDDALAGATVDYDKKLVTMSAGPYAGRAKYYGDQGCVILHPLAADAFFEPVTVPRVEADDGLFPEAGDLLSSDDALPEGYRREALRSAVDAAFDPQGHTVSLIVMHKGALVVERYRDGITKDTPTLNWSMGKSILGALIGRLEHMGALSLDDPAPIGAWNAFPGDPRADIKIIDLMRMSGGLQCNRSTPPWKNRGGVFDAHNKIYLGPLNVIDHAITSPFKHPPNEGWQYNNCDMQALGSIIKTKIAERGEDYLTWPYEHFYNKIGMSGMVSEVDTYGNFHLTGFDYGRARDWARYGQLFLNGGVWNGERLLSERFVATVGEAGPIWASDDPAYRDEENIYGATHWVNDRGALPLPRDAYWALGFGGNLAIIAPSEDLVIVLLRLTNTVDTTFEQTNEVLSGLMDGLGIEIK